MNPPASPPPELDETRVGVFLRAVAIGEVAVVDAMLQSAPALVNAVGPHPFWGGRPQPLHVAIETGRAVVIQRLLEGGADVSGSNDPYDHWSPLMLAVQRRRDQVRDELLRRGAHVGLAEALLLGDDARVEALLAETPLSQVVPNGGSFVAFARTPHAIDQLIQAGASPTQPDRWGTTPLSAFSRLGPTGTVLVQHLATHGVVAGPVELARLGDQEGLERLARQTADAVARDEVLLTAVEGGHHGLVGWLLDRGASASARATDRSRQTALHEAAWHGDVAMVELLVARGADPGALDEEHRATPREWAETSVTVTNNLKCADVVAWFHRRTTL